MDLKEAIAARHSVRSYVPRPLSVTTAAELERLIAEYNERGGLHLQLVKDEPKAFDSRMGRLAFIKYGRFAGVTNYITLVGKKSPDFEEKCGYYGELLVLEARRMGLDTCWVGLTYKKIPDAFTVESGEKLLGVIALGYGVNHGKERKSKSPTAIAPQYDTAPDWFKNGIDGVLLAPTAVNQQKFTFTLDGDHVIAKAGMGFYTKTDLGIAKCHFEICSDRDESVWKN